MLAARQSTPAGRQPPPRGRPLSASRYRLRPRRQAGPFGREVSVTTGAATVGAATEGVGTSSPPDDAAGGGAGVLVAAGAAAGLGTSSPSIGEGATAGSSATAITVRSAGFAGDRPGLPERTGVGGEAIISTFDPAFGPARASPVAPETKNTTAAEANNRSMRPLDIASHPSKTCENLNNPNGIVATQRTSRKRTGSDRQMEEAVSANDDQYPINNNRIGDIIIVATN